jgi:2-oxoglutarate/2-oxoacid ferredoxin oxidoreductase subunit alpha
MDKGKFMDLNIRIAGEAGQGVQTTGNLLIAVFARMGLHVLATQSYMSRIRGGLNWFDIRIGDSELFAGRDGADVLVALTPEALQVLGYTVADGGVILFDGDKADGALAMGFTAIAKEVAKSPVMANTVACGAVMALLGYDVQPLCEHLEKQFRKKGDEVIQSNIRCAQRGAEIGAACGEQRAGPAPGETPREVCSGTETVGLAAATAGVKFAAAYPMTPSTGVFTYLASVADRYGIVVEQAEDEIAAVNMICGATYAGVPAMATTSGGGFALMTEGVSLAGIMELPILIMVSQRPGPATGLPTRTAQQDLKFVLNSGHGEFPRAIYAPGTPAQAYELTRLALETAHKYQTPTFLLIDQFLADLQTTMDALDDTPRLIDRRIVADAKGDYVRYALSENGVSPRAIPGGEAIVVCDSDEHTEDGHITEDLGVRIQQDDKRMSKHDGLTAEALAPEWYGPDDAETVLLTWGSTYGPAREAIDRLVATGVSAGLLHFAQVWPINAPAVRKALERRKRVISIEGNHTAQLASILREAMLLGECESILRYDGMPFTGEGIARKVTS